MKLIDAFPSLEPSSVDRPLSEPFSSTDLFRTRETLLERMKNIFRFSFKNKSNSFGFVAIS